MCGKNTRISRTVNCTIPAEEIDRERPRERDLEKRSKKESESADFLGTFENGYFFYFPLVPLVSRYSIMF